MDFRTGTVAGFLVRVDNLKDTIQAIREEHESILECLKALNRSLAEGLVSCEKSLAKCQDLTKLLQQNRTKKPCGYFLVPQVSSKVFLDSLVASRWFLAFAYIKHETKMAWHWFSAKFCKILESQESFEQNEDDKEFDADSDADSYYSFSGSDSDSECEENYCGTVPESEC